MENGDKTSVGTLLKEGTRNMDYHDLTPEQKTKAMRLDCHMSVPTHVLEVASSVLDMDSDALLGSYVPVKGTDAWYFWQPMRGGRSVIVDGDGSFLVATSSVNPERHVLEFRAGMRSVPSSDDSPEAQRR